MSQNKNGFFCFVGHNKVEVSKFFSKTVQIIIKDEMSASIHSSSKYLKNIFVTVVLFCLSACVAQQKSVLEKPRPFPKIVDYGLKPVSIEQPCYPARAVRNGTEGWVQLEFSLDDSGKVSDIVSLDNSPAGIFEACALRSMQKWVFEVPEKSKAKKRYRYVFQFTLG